MTESHAEDALVEDLEQLIILLGGSPDSFTGVLCGLILKADPANLDALRAGFPLEVMAVRGWQGTAHQTIRWWRRYITESRRAIEAVRRIWSVPLPPTSSAVSISVIPTGGGRYVAQTRHLPTVELVAVGPSADADAGELADALAFGDTAQLAQGWTCALEGCRHTLPCQVVGAPQLSGVLAPMGDPNLRYARWCSWRCLVKWAADVEEAAGSDARHP